MPCSCLRRFFPARQIHFPSKIVQSTKNHILYVTYGAGHAFGIDLDKCFEEVQNSNMSKLDENGKPIYNEAGKVMKGPNYFKPDLSKFVN